MSEILQAANAWYAVLLAMAAGLVAFALKSRKDWAASKTNTVMEAAQQAGIASMVAALAASQARETEAWAQVADARKARENLLAQMGHMQEDIADLRAREDACQREMDRIRSAIQREGEAAEGRHRALRNALANRDARIHDLMNRLKEAGGSLTGTDMIPRED